MIYLGPRSNSDQQKINKHDQSTMDGLMIMHTMITTTMINPQWTKTSWTMAGGRARPGLNVLVTAGKTRPQCSPGAPPAVAHTASRGALPPPFRIRGQHNTGARNTSAPQPKHQTTTGMGGVTNTRTHTQYLPAHHIGGYAYAQPQQHKAIPFH